MFASVFVSVFVPVHSARVVEILSSSIGHRSDRQTSVSVPVSVPVSVSVSVSVSISEPTASSKGNGKLRRGAEPLGDLAGGEPLLFAGKYVCNN